MSRNLLMAVAGLFVLSLLAAWNGRKMRETMMQVEAHVAGANEQRKGINKLNAGFQSLSGLPRMEDSVLALAEHVAPFLTSTTPNLAGAAIGQEALRRTIWRPTSWGAERALEVFENAQTLIAGHFDLALVMVAVLPLVLLFAPRQDLLLLSLGPVFSLIGILLSGAPLASADTWIRTAAWLVVTGLYGFFWLLLRGRVSSAWKLSVAYVVVVLLVPGLALALGALLVPAPSRVELAARTQIALRPVMEKTSRDLAPFYDSHPEYRDAGHTAAQYDRIRLRVEAERQASVKPLLDEAAESANRHRNVVKGLSMLSPAAILHLALLETAGTGLSRTEDFEASAVEFGKRWSADIGARLAAGRPMRPAELDQLPVFQYQEQAVTGWIVPVGIGLIGLLIWLGAVRAIRA